MMKYDVVVVGAGPAGSTAAKYASIGGAKVLMIEKRQEIGSPVRCGEGIAKDVLERADIKPNSKWIANEVKGARVISPDGSIMHLTEKMAGNEVGYVLHRDTFDKELAKEAARAGVDIIVKCSATDVIRENGVIKGIKVNHMGEEFDVKADIVIGADGFESQIGRWAGIDTALAPNDVMSCLEYVMVGIDIDKNCNDFFLGPYYAPGGYIWVFPKGEDTANIGIGMQLSKIKNRGDVKKYLDLFVKRHPNISKGKVVEQIAGGVSVCAPIDQTVADGIMLVGDSARQIDPLTGGGIANACIAGRIAGKVAADAVKKRDFSKNFFMAYETGWRKEFEDSMYRNYVAKEKLIAMNDDVFNKVIKALSDVKLDRIGTRELLSAIKAKYPQLVKEFEDML
ncbi:MAG: NAD(P)/FAD-dependent oxidoreductase [Thermoplasmata archaeon]